MPYVILSIVVVGVLVLLVVYSKRKKEELNKANKERHPPLDASQKNDQNTQIDSGDLSCPNSDESLETAGADQSGKKPANFNPRNVGIKLISLKCPECGAALSVEENRKQAFCSYCGVGIVLQKENEYVIRTVNDAEVVRAKTEQMVAMKKAEVDPIRLQKDAIVKSKELELKKKERELQLKQREIELEREKSRARTNKTLGFIVIALIICIIVVSILIFLSSI